MLMWIILSSAFVAIFLLVRALFSNKIKATAMYALWILVAVRLLVPTYIPVEMNLFNNINMPSITTQIAEVEDGTNLSFDTVVLPDETVNNNVVLDAQEPPLNETISDTTAAIAPSETIASKVNVISIHPLLLIWIIGMIAFACYFIISNLRFHSMLLKRRVLLEQHDYTIPVYFVEGLHSPCMTGILNPAIYVNEHLTEQDHEKYVLDHEFIHYKRKDNIWMLIQTICLCIHWYNPLVWIASAMFRRDCECACDESLTRTLSDENRVLYGKTLLRFAEEKWNVRSIFSTSTSMSMEGKTMKKRVHIIINHPPKRIISSVIAVILAIVLFAGAFVVNSSEKDDPSINFFPIDVEVIEAGVFQDYGKCGSVTHTTEDGETKTTVPVSLYYSLWIENHWSEDLNDLDFKIVANEELETFLLTKKYKETEDISELYKTCDSVLETLSGSSNTIGQLDMQSRSSISFSYELAYDYESLIENGVLKAEDDTSNTKDIMDYVYDVTLIIYNEGKELSRVDLSTFAETGVSTDIDKDSSEEDVTYELSLRRIGKNETPITSNQITVLPGDLVLSLSERISDDVVNKRVEGDFIEGGIENAIVNIDYPSEQTQLDGTVVVAFEHIMSDVKAGQVITVTITEELQERLGLSDDQIVITCAGYDSQILGSWETELESNIIGDVPAELEGVDSIHSTFNLEFYENGTGKWTMTYDEQYGNLFQNELKDFTYTLDSDNLTITFAEGNKMRFVVTCASDTMFMDGFGQSDFNMIRKN